MADFQKPVWDFKFELAPGKWVFVPDETTREFGRQLKQTIQSSWHAPDCYVHLGSRGHVRALHDHLASTYFARVDLKAFFNSINKTRVTRNLKSLLGSYDDARAAAVMSTVPDPTTSRRRYVVPFGFVQSPILAALCLANSKLGSTIRSLSKSFAVTVYVDDILISTTGALQPLVNAYGKLIEAAEASNFAVSAEKLMPPSTDTKVFNIALSKGRMRISDERLAQFRQAILDTGSERTISGILGYVNTVNISQAEELADLLGRTT